MDFEKYQSAAHRTANKYLTDNEQLLCGVLGLNGEAGEAADVVKKWRFQGHDLDREKLKNELGDVLWYLAETSTALGISLDEIAEANIQKLKTRYPGAFSPAQSINRTG